MKIINFTELSLNLKHWLDSFFDETEEVIIKRKDQKDLVLISLEKYNALVETNYLLSGKNRGIILESLKEVSHGQQQYHELIEE